MRFKSYFKSPYQTKVAYHEHMLEMFGICEDTEDRKRVLELIKANKWETDPTSFYASLHNSKHPMMLTDYSVSDLSKMKCFKLRGYNIGFALKNFEDKGQVEIVAVHNNSDTVKGIGDDLMRAAIHKGGKYLDHFDGMLTDLYSKAGFKEYRRDPYNPDYDPDGKFASKYGKKDVIYRKLETA